jgi:hypothetical protein
MNTALPRPVPLHLEAAGGALVETEGPAALRIENEDGRIDHIPLRRVSRVIASHRVQFTTGALLACAERGIVIVLHGPDERVAARLLGNAAQTAGLRQRLLDFADRPDWRERYEDWRLANRQRICATLARRLQAPPGVARNPRRLQGWLLEQGRLLAGPGANSLSRRLLRQQSLAWMQEALLEQGVGAENELWTAGRPDLALDLGALLALRLETARLGWLRARAAGAARRGQPVAAPTRRQIVARLESQRPRLERLGADLINRLHRWLIECA